MVHPTIRMIQIQNLQINPLPLHTFKINKANQQWHYKQAS